MFASQTNLFSKIVCPSIELNIQCETLNCVFRHPEEEEKRKLIKSSFNKAEYTDRYQAFIHPNTLDNRHRLIDKQRRSSSKSQFSPTHHETPRQPSPPVVIPAPVPPSTALSKRSYVTSSTESQLSPIEDPYAKRLRMSQPMGGEGIEPPEFVDDEFDENFDPSPPPPPPVKKVTSTNLTPLKTRRIFGRSSSSSADENGGGNVVKPEPEKLLLLLLMLPTTRPIQRFDNVKQRVNSFDSSFDVQATDNKRHEELIIDVSLKRKLSPDPVAVPTTSTPILTSSKRVIGGANAKTSTTSGANRLIGGKNLVPVNTSTKKLQEEVIDLKRIDKEIELVPKPVIPFPPAQTSVRLRYMTLLHHLYETSGLKFPNRDAVIKEYEIATTTTNRTYETVIKREIFQMANPETTLGKSSTTLLKVAETEEKKEELLNSLISDQRKLSQNGYITKIPELPEDFESATMTKCDRCGLDFDKTKIFKRTKCLYHPDRFSLSRQTLGSHASNDYNSKYYPCCSQPVGESEGCKRSRYHVFKNNSPQELQHAIPFISTDEFTKTPETLKAIALDCEMGYTTAGFELIRLTMIDFYTEKVIYDKTIKPEGRIVDLNTYWSGVLSIDEEKSPSFAEFLQEISQFIDKDTILIGHSLENDLNVMRLIHHKVIDTSLMFANGLRKRSLKELTFEFLSKKIQGGEHDSEEDAKSCISLVKWQIEQLMK